MSPPTTTNKPPHLTLPVTKVRPLLRTGSVLPSDPALRAIADDLIAEVRYVTAVAAAEQRDAPGTLHSAVREFLSTRNPAAQQRARLHAKAMLAAPDAQRAQTFGRFARVKVDEYLSVGSTESMSAAAPAT